MQFLSTLAEGRVDFVLLLFLRTSGLIFSSPVFGHKNIPPPVKIGFSVALTALFYQTLAFQSVPVYESVYAFIGLCLIELLFGLIMGYVLNLFFSVAITAGQMIDMQMGFGMATVFDPQFAMSVPVMGNLLNYVLLIAFFISGGQQKLVSILYIAMIEIPVGQAAFSPDLGVIAAELFARAFVLAVSFALPVLASGLLGEVAMGVIIRTVPQLNMFVIGMPVKVVLGFLVMLLALPALVRLTNPLFEQMFAGLEQMFAGLAGGGT